MNNSSKIKSKRPDKSPKTKSPSSDATAKGNASDSSYDTSSPMSHTPNSSTPAHSPMQTKKSEQSVTDSLGGATVAGSSLSLSLGSVTTTSGGLLSPSAIKPSPTLWFTTEIQQMMFGFGDCRKPLAESASLVEEIVHQQMISLLYNAEEAAKMRNARFIGIEDFLFLLRKDKIKLRRLLRYMAFKDVKQHALRPTVEEDELLDQGIEPKQPMTKRQKICYDFLSTIDQTGELLALTDDYNTDEVKHERALRAELQTRSMDSQQYLEFCEARQVSFTPRYKIQKFKDWLMAGVMLDIKPNPLAMEVLSYMAYETIAQVVDLTLLVKQDQRASVDDPFSLTTAAVCINHEVPQSAQTSEGLLTTASAASAALKSPPANPAKISSPTSSPPETPTTPGSVTSAISLSQSSSLTSAAKSKNKKKKKSGSISSRDVFTSQAITPSDIREALRRYGQCVGPFADFSKCPLLNPHDKLLCC